MAQRRGDQTDLHSAEPFFVECDVQRTGRGDQVFSPPLASTLPHSSQSAFALILRKALGVACRDVRQPSVNQIENLRIEGWSIRVGRIPEIFQPVPCNFRLFFRHLINQVVKCFSCRHVQRPQTFLFYPWNSGPSTLLHTPEGGLVGFATDQSPPESGWYCAVKSQSSFMYPTAKGNGIRRHRAKVFILGCDGVPRCMTSLRAAEVPSASPPPSP